MNTASIPAEHREAPLRDEPLSERTRPWIAATVSVLLHALLILLALLTPPMVMTPPEEGAEAGSRIQVDMIGETSPQPTPPVPDVKVPPTQPARAAPAASRMKTALVMQTENVVPPDADTSSDAATKSPDSAEETAPQPPQPVAASPPPTTQRRTRSQGRPPGMSPEHNAEVNAGRARSSNVGAGSGRRGAGSGPSMDAGGYQVYYDVFSEMRLRAWKEQGIEEIFIPLPGTRQYMVCKLEIALRRGSGDCRLLEPEDPEMENIGDSRKVIDFHQVYRRGELVWRGPGAYR